MAASIAVATTLALPTAAAVPGHRDRDEQAWIRSTIRQMTLEQKVGQLFVPYVNGSTAR